MLLSSQKQVPLFANAFLALVSFLFVSRLLNIAGFRYYPTINRVTYADGFAYDTISGLPQVDDLLLIVIGLLCVFSAASRKTAIATAAIYIGLAAVSFASTSAFLDVIAFSILPVSAYFAIRGRVRLFNAQMYIMFGLSIITVIELVTLGRLVLYPLTPNSFYSSDWSWKIPLLERQIFYALASLAPPLMMLLVFSFVLKINSQYLAAVVRRMFSVSDSGDDGNNNNSNGVKIDRSLTRTIDSIADDILSYRRTWTAVIILLAVFIPAFPYIPSINPDHQSRATDVVFYESWVNALASKESTGEVLYASFFGLSGDELSQGRGDRPVTLLLLYSIYRLTSLPLVHIIQLFPVLLTLLLAAVSYFLLRAGTRNTHTSTLAAFLSLTSFHVVVGIYAGFLANWLAIVFNYAAFGFLILAWDGGRKLHYLLFATFVFLSMLAHVHTWIYLIASIGLFVAASLAISRDRASAKKAATVALVILAALAVDLSNTFLQSTTALGSDIGRAGSAISVDNFGLRWSTLYYNFRIWFGGYYANTVTLALAIVGVVATSWNKTFDRLILVSTFIASAVVIFGDYGIQARMFYMMPVHILAATGIMRIMNVPWLTGSLKLSILLFACLYLVTYAIRSASNLEFKL